jgi:serine/threonine protein kinase
MENINALKPGARLKSPKREYVIDSVLGAGGFGITYKVWSRIKVDNVTVKTYFALKEFFLSDSCERKNNTTEVVYSSPVKDKVQEAMHDFLSEAKRLNGLSESHPGIVSVNEVFEDNGTAYYVMEYIEGGSIRKYVRANGALNQQDAVNLILPMVEAMELLHKNNITHLDIKPDNIMLHEDEDTGRLRPVLIDFGLSKHYDNKGNPTSTIRATGISAGYAPLEQYTGISSFTPQADVYGLCATLYYLLAGKDPAIASEIKPDIVIASLPQEVDESLRKVIADGMHPYKSERIQSMSELHDRLTDAINPQKEEKKKEEKNGNNDTIIINKPVQPIKPKTVLSKGALYGIIGGIAALIIIILLVVSPGKSNTSEASTENNVEETQDKDVSDMAFDGYTYTGHITNGVPNGEGEAKYDNGSVYKGSWVNGVRTGDNAYFLFSDGNVFKGTFENDEIVKGELTSNQNDETNGMTYKGTFKNGQPYEGYWYNIDGSVYYHQVAN